MPRGDVSVVVSDAVLVEDSTAVEVELAPVVGLSALPVPTGIGILAPVVALAEAGTGTGTGNTGAEPEGEAVALTELTTGAGAPGVMVARRQVSGQSALMNAFEAYHRRMA